MEEGKLRKEEEGRDGKKRHVSDVSNREVLDCTMEAANSSS